MAHPHAPPQPWPATPEHVRPLGPNDKEARAGVLWCIRCGRVLWTTEKGNRPAKACVQINREIDVLAAPAAPAT